MRRLSWSTQQVYTNPQPILHNYGAEFAVILRVLFSMWFASTTEVTGLTSSKMRSLINNNAQQRVEQGRQCPAWRYTQLSSGHIVSNQALPPFQFFMLKFAYWAKEPGSRLLAIVLNWSWFTDWVYHSNWPNLYMSCTSHMYLMHGLFTIHFIYKHNVHMYSEVSSSAVITDWSGSHWVSLP